MTADNPVTSMTMIEKAKSGNNEAWVQLTNIYGPLVHGQCIRKGLQSADAKDVTMDVFRSIYESLNAFTKDRESDRFLKFLRTITTRRIADHLRREARRQDKAIGGESDWFQQVPETDAPLAGPDEETAMESLWSIEDVLTSLEAQIWRDAKQKYGKNKTFQAFEMREVRGMDVAVIAQELGIKQSAVRTFASRVKTWIKTQVETLPQEQSEVPDDASVADLMS